MNILKFNAYDASMFTCDGSQTGSGVHSVQLVRERDLKSVGWSRLSPR